MVYTIFALDFNNKVLGDHLLVSRENLAAAIDELVAYWEAQQTEGDIHDQAVVGVHWEVYEGAVRNRQGWKPLSWEPSRSVIDLTKSEVV
jgi:hypothetical protein